jgi:hypothetical protein
MRGLAVLAASALVFSGGTALAAHTSTPKAPKHVSASTSWKEGKPSDFAGTRFDGAYDPTSKKVYFLGFRTTGDATDGTVWSYDPATATYAMTGATMQVPISNYQIAPLTDTKGFGLYIFGGRDANAQLTTATQVYYPGTNTVKTIGADPWPGTTPSGCVSLPAMGVATYKNKAYVMGGAAFSANGCVADENSAQTWVFDPMAAGGSRWKKLPKLNVARGYVTPVVAGKTLYAIGGDVNDAGSLVPQATVEKLNLANPLKWNDGKVADLIEPCDESQAFYYTAGPLANNLILAGCGQWPNALPDNLAYDIAADSWSIVGALKDNVRNQAGWSKGTGAKMKMYILGGFGEASGFVDPVNNLQIGKTITASGPARTPQLPRGGRGSTS